MNIGLNDLFQRDLDRLKKEILAYKIESTIWLIPEGISNSGGTLALHLVGNLNHFIGAILGETGYIRNREGEFNDRDIPISTIVKSIDEVKIIVSETLLGFQKDQLSRTYPIDVQGRPRNTGTFLLHLYGHLNYHLGQINYHRRLSNLYS